MDYNFFLIFISYKNSIWTLISNADIEKHINDENPTILDTTAAICVINKLLYTVNNGTKSVAVQTDVLGKKLYTMS